MDNNLILTRLEKRVAESEEMIAGLRRQMVDLKKVIAMKAYAEEACRLRDENKALVLEVENLKSKLIRAEISNNIQQISIPDDRKKSSSHNVNLDTKDSAGVTLGQQNELVSTPNEQVSNVKISNKLKAADGDKKIVPKKNLQNENKGKPKESSEKKSEPEPDVSRLDLRIGLILNAKKHPDADSLYVEEVNVGEEKNRTVVSGLVKYVPIDQMQNRLAVLLCNLKPAKMRGVTSEAMVMCASTPEKVEILVPPPGSVPGDRVTCDGYSGEPDKELNPKKKIFEKVAPDLRTDANCNATYKSVPLKVEGKGVVVAPTLANVQIK